MRKTFSIILSVSLILSSLIFPTIAVTAQTTALDDYGWEGTAQVYSASKSARYFRTKVLSDGSVGAVYYRSGLGDYFAKSYDGGVTFEDEVLLLPNATDSKNADSPFVTEEMPYGRGRLEAQNPNLIQLDNGDIMVFHRYNTYTGEPEVKPWSIYYSSIVYQTSSDGGASWTEEKVMTSIALDKSYDGYGLWEPDPYIINGKLFVYYADTYTPNNLNYQHIMYCIWDEATKSFSEPAIAQNGIDHKSRDGMSVVTKLSDGSYAMVFESTKTANTDNTFVIKMSLSKDGMNWTHPVIVASPDTVLSETATASSERAVCASPYIITLPDGRVAVSYQTTDRYSGIIPDRVSYRVVPEVRISKEPISYNSFDSMQNGMTSSDYVNATEYFTELKNGPDVFDEDYFGKSASMLYINNRLMVYYNIGENRSATYHYFCAMKVSYAKIGLATDYSSISNYKALNAGNNVITEQNGTFTLPSSTSTLLAADKNAATPFEVSFDAADYTLYSTSSNYKVTFNAANKTIYAASTGKAMLKGTQHLSAFNASVDIAGNPNSGFTKAGFAFHVQNSDFESNYFNTAGYSVFIRRETASLDTVSIVYRYCTNGTSVYSYVAGSYKNLDPEKLDYKFTLELVVNEDKFYAQLKDESGKVLINAKEAPLNEKASGKTKYYSAGSLVLINDLAHTFSNIKITETTKLIETDYLRAHAAFTIAESGDNQVGFAIRAQNSTKGSPGYEGFVIKLVNNNLPDGSIGLQFTRYGTNSAGKKYVNLGNAKTYIDKTVLNGVSPFGATVIMDAEIDGNVATVTLTNPHNHSLHSTYTFDLTDNSGSYSTYYEKGGFGIFNHSANTVYVSELDFSTERECNNSIDYRNFTVYQPSEINRVKYNNQSFLSTDSSTKKIMLTDSFNSEFTANATFEIANDGELKAGIIFRAQSVGNATDDMEGYSIVLVKRANSDNNGRIQFAFYKWVRTKTGKLSYYGSFVKNLFDYDTLNSAYPECKTSLLASIGKRIKLNVTVSDNIAIANFDIVDVKGNILASSPTTLSYDLTTKRTPSATGSFTSDGANTLFGAGEIGVSINTATRFCDFSLTSSDTDDLENKKLTYEPCNNGLIFTTLCGGAADDGKLVKVIALPDDGCKLFAIYKTVNDITEKLSLADGEYSFIKEAGATTIWAVFKKIGDLNGDDIINSLDLSDMRKFLISKNELSLFDGDINEDSEINIIDLVKLKKLTATAES